MSRLLLASTLVWLLVAACAGGRPCGELSLSPAAATALADIRGTAGLPLVLPWACDSRLLVTAVFEDTIPERGMLLPRVNFVVSRDGERGFLFSQTRALLPFSQIPQSTHRLRASAAGVSADGFAGPAGTGEDIAYLRWRSGGVTFELSATLRPWLSESDVRTLAEGLMGRAPPR